MTGISDWSRCNSLIISISQCVSSSLCESRDFAHQSVLQQTCSPTTAVYTHHYAPLCIKRIIYWTMNFDLIFKNCVTNKNTIAISVKKKPLNFQAYRESKISDYWLLLLLALHDWPNIKRWITVMNRFAIGCPAVLGAQGCSRAVYPTTGWRRRN